MDAVASSVLLFGVFIAVLLFNVPIATSLGLAALVSIFVTDLPVGSIAVNMYAASHKFSLLAIPFFIIGGNIMEKAGISEKLIVLGRAMVGHTRMGLITVCVVVTCFFAAIAGSGPATVAALGSILIPAMIYAGYSKSFSSALMASGGAIGVIIPPSVTFIVFASISGASVGKMFMAGVIPGILMGAALWISARISQRNTEITVLPKAAPGERWAAFKDAVWGLFMPVIILGGIYSGIFTPTEAACVSAVYGILVGLFVCRNMTLKDLEEVFFTSAAQTGQVLFIMMCAALFAWVITINGIGSTIGGALLDISSGNLMILLLICNIILIVAGMVIDAVSALYIFTPILWPVASAMGYDITAFGIMMCVNLAIGLVTPPVGVNLYVACSVAAIKLREIISETLPLVAMLLIVLILVTYFPEISLFLPNLLGQ